jgi:sugar lactone lactonase YvrE
MRRWLIVLTVAALALTMLGSAGSAEAKHSFPDFIPFDRDQGEFPEGVAVDKVGNVYVSIDSSGQIWKFTPDGERSILIDFDGAGALGLAVNARGDVYVARGLLFQGVWKVDNDGNAELVPGTDAIAVANALAFDKRGNLYITESFSLDDPQPYPCPNAGESGGGIFPAFGQGSIWKVPKGGEAELWIRDEVLTGLCLAPIPYPIGANGIAYRNDAVYVNNTETAAVLRVPINKGGSAGAPVVLAEVTGIDPVFGAPAIDGMALDVHGNIYVPVINQSRIVKISPDGYSVDTIATLADGLDFPASLAFGTGKGERQSLFVTNFSIGPPILAGPGLLKLDAGVPGMPLP